MQNIKLSIIIVNYNSLNYLKKCIESIINFNDIGDQVEVIVVDNSDDNKTEIWLAEYYPGIKCINNDNKGFGQANNVGAKEANGEYILFLNPDTIIVEPVFKHAISCFENDDKLGSFGYMLTDIDGNMNASFGSRLAMGMAVTTVTKLCIKVGFFIPTKMFTSGADLFIRKDVFFNCGQFDEKIFMYCEEADIANRVNKLGYSIAYYPDKKIVHLEGKSSGNSVTKQYKRVLSAREYYCQKYGIDFKKMLKREYRYCCLKYYVGLIRNPKENPYYDIKEELKEYIKKYSRRER